MKLLENAKSKKDELARIAATLQKQLKSAPKGNLCVSKSHKSFQYHMTKEGNPNKKYYLNKSKRDIAIALAQRDYNKKLLAALKENLVCLNNFTKTYKPQKLQECYTKLPMARKKLITPLFISDTEYANQWQNKEYEHKKDAPDGRLLTMKNEPVRSKSEIIIANLLNAHNIPYHYEYPVHIKSSGTFHVDFLCLNPRTRQEFYWEHCGKMDDPDYTSSMTQRISSYAKAGIIIGKNLILTMETAQTPLNTKEAELIIKSFLL